MACFRYLRNRRVDSRSERMDNEPLSEEMSHTCESSVAIFAAQILAGSRLRLLTKCSVACKR